jgi:precorrin-6B methylase 2
MAYNGTGRPEPVGHDLAPVFQFKDCVFVGGSQASFEALMTKAWDNLKRKGRIG